MRITGEKIFNIIILIVIAFFVYGAIDFSPKARLLPWVVGIPALVLMVILVAGDWLRPKQEDALSAEEQQRQWIMFGALTVFLVLILVFGVIAGIGLFLLFFLRFISRQSWLLSVLVGLGGSALTYGLFGMLLHYALYEGLIGAIL